MYNVKDFIKWALTHAKLATIPSGAILPLPIDECGIQPWEYLFGSVRVQTTQATLDRYFTNHYGNPKSYNPPMTRAKYDQITKNWDRNGYATDCQGLLDAYLTYECNEKTDINADMNYRLWCTEKGKNSEISREYKIGEALFMINKAGTKMTHIGWVCGFKADGEPLVVEARGIYYGVVVTTLTGRAWTHRGLMTEKFEYPEDEDMEVKFEYVKPMHEGEPYKAMQAALNKAGYVDYNGVSLDEDGKWGKKSQYAFEAMIAEYAAPYEPEEYTITISNDEAEKLYEWKCYI